MDFPNNIPICFVKETPRCDVSTVRHMRIEGAEWLFVKVSHSLNFFVAKKLKGVIVSFILRTVVKSLPCWWSPVSHCIWLNFFNYWILNYFRNGLSNLLYITILVVYMTNYGYIFWFSCYWNNYGFIWFFWFSCYWNNYGFIWFFWFSCYWNNYGFIWFFWFFMLLK